jgi:pimeloyl-ACP methyl ester carboxylesterase
MKKNVLKLTIIILILIIGILGGIFLRQNNTTWSMIKSPFVKAHNTFENKRNTEWNTEFKIVEIKSTRDSSFQKSYFYKSKSKESKPLIVSLHNWSGDYLQNDVLAEMCKLKDLNYIHPDFRGANKTINTCCSELVVSDIDDSITYAIKNSNVDLNKIYVVGASGGGYATLCTFMKSKHQIKKFSAWAAITDLVT